MIKQLLLLVGAVIALGAGVAYGRTTWDVYTDGASLSGPRDPYTDGGKAGKYDVYTDGAKIGDKRDPFTDGA
ncbi:hypothetical protein [Ralstonia sp. SET104]|uniref:hypothetical protein n=1 Tax=Ralstonia sp. SET104 TaxID=2448774 RepID=UPI000F5742C1|nr:hypothetical protein [Ralstonia sp. SET104]GCB05267.1 hypothetical protein PSUB009319_28980 [Ralstonia sp. SET104]